MLVTFCLVYLLVQVVFFILGELSARGGLDWALSRPATLRCEPVTLIKPVYGADEFTHEAFLSWLTQDYPGELQILFSFQDPQDPALALVESLKDSPGLHPFEILVNPIRPGYHGKSSNLLHGMERASHDILVFSDADIIATPNTLRQLVGALQSGLEIAGCMIRHTRAPDFWGGLYAFVWNVATLQAGGLPMRYGIGPVMPGGTVAFTRRALADLGGVESFGRYVAEDVALGLTAARLGIPRGLGGMVESPVTALGRDGLVQKLSRLRIYCQLPGWPLNLIAAVGFMSGYLLVLVGFLASGDPCLIGAISLFLVARVLLWRRFTRLAEGKARGGLDFLVVDYYVLVVGLQALFSPRMSWAGIRYQVDASGRIIPPEG